MPELKSPLAADSVDVAETLQWDYERREPVSPLPVSGALISVDGNEYVITLAPDQHANASLWRVFESIKRLEGRATGNAKRLKVAPADTN
jgi:hypothetical protein